MFNRLMPREGRFFDLFNAHANHITTGARELVALLNDGNSEFAEHARRIDESERAADKVTHDAITLLHKTFITPLAREDIHGLITCMDDVLDLIQDVTESIVLYDVTHIPEHARRLAEIDRMCCDRVKAAVALLSDMRNADAILKTCEEIDRLESDADRVMRTAMSSLFREEPDVRQVIKLRIIYDLLERVSDRCEDVANIIEGIVLENS
jgi:predicted phosphate transport protein (TIGR00153 family)